MQSEGPGKSGRLPPHPLDKRWHVYIDDKTYGPYTGHEIARMAKLGEVAEYDLIYPEDGAEWQPAVDDPVLGRLFGGREAAGPSFIGNPGQHRNFRKWLFLVPTMIVIGWVVWPYYAAYDLAAALRGGDVATLESRVAWDSVRRGLRDDLNVMLLKSINRDKDSDVGALGNAFAVVLGPAIVDRMVESFVTPQAIAAAASLRKSDGKTNNAAEPNAENVNSVVQAAWRVRLDQVKYAFFAGSPFTFRVDIMPDGEYRFRQPIQYRFDWGGSWKLSRIVLPPDMFEGLPALEKKLKLDQMLDQSDNQAKKKAPRAVELTPQPIQVSLITKNYKAANINSGDFLSQITIELAIKNGSGRDVRAFDGVLTFTDLLGNKILSSRIAINEVLKEGAILNWKGAIDYNEFIDSHRSLRSESKDNLKVTFSTRKILFADGTTREF